MSYRNKTYVIFDGDEDMWAYRFMRGWRATEHLDFDFYDAHDIKPLTDGACDETIFRRLRERMGNAKQAIVLIGPYTKSLRKFVPWEIGIAKTRKLPIVAVNLNNLRRLDSQRCPASLCKYPAVHVPFKMRIIKQALDAFVPEFALQASSWEMAPRHYDEKIYGQLGL